MCFLPASAPPEGFMDQEDVTAAPHSRWAQWGHEDESEGKQGRQFDVVSVSWLDILL